ncbi:DUF1592 domain-containing protein [bacterium]|nr:DUF1592 domain-containing protein [bacterium]
MRLVFSSLFFLFAACPLLAESREAVSFEDLSKQFDHQIHPLMKQFCLDCHSTAKLEGDLDLERFAKLEDVRSDSKAWVKVVEMLGNGEMPPKESKQLSAAQKKELLGWVEAYLHAEALSNAGDPGPVVLRRLNNAEYTYTVRDLTHVPLSPAREFPNDSAAGEGFSNTGNSLVMSPALLTKYMDAGKEIASHAVLLPEGFRFSPNTSRRDWTEENLAEIREFYSQYTEAGGSDTVTQQGIELDKNRGGELPLKKYLLASLEVRDGKGSVEKIADAHHLSPKYLRILMDVLNGKESSPLFDPLRSKWRAAKPEEIDGMIAMIKEWQSTLWKFSSVGHIGKVGGPKAWMEPVTPLVVKQEFRTKLTPAAGQEDVVIYLIAGDAGDGNANDFVEWQAPQLAVAGRPPILLRDLRNFVHDLNARREKLLASTAKALDAAAEASESEGDVDTAKLAEKFSVDPDALKSWLDYLGIGSDRHLKLSHLSTPLQSQSNYDFVKGWGSPDLPSLLANSSDQNVRVPGNLKAHGVVVHPTPDLVAAVGWQSPVKSPLRIEGKVTHAHPECGNGVTWSLELRRGKTRQRLASGISHGGSPVVVGPIENVAVQPGDLVSLLIGPRDANHSCDLTDIELNLTSSGEVSETWSLNGDITENVLAGNPHADKKGRADVWHFYSEPVTGATNGPVIPAGSLLAQWQSAEKPAEKHRLAEEVQKLLTSAPPKPDSPDGTLYRELTSLSGPLFAGTSASKAESKGAPESKWGLDPALFGKHPKDGSVDSSNLCIQAPAVIEIHLPPDLVAGSEFVTTGALEKTSGAEGSVQLQVSTTKPAETTGIVPSGTKIGSANGTWSSNNQVVSYATPILVSEGSAARKRVEANFDSFRQTFPASLCYTKIVPVDEVVTLTLFHREDDHLCRLILTDEEKAKLDRMWEEFHFVSQDPLKLVDAFEQLWQFATQDADPSAFEPMRKPINDRAAEFRKKLIAAEPKHVDALVKFASQAYRRPITAEEENKLRQLYAKLREQELPHDEAIQFAMARIFVAPAFLYRLEAAPEGISPAKVSDWELANRLSYFLWASQPDDELRSVAASGQLSNPEQLKAQAHRMLKDPKVRRMATEFACQWLHIYDFDALDEKSEKHFPEFAELRGDMYEESIRFFTDLFQNDLSIIEVFDADHTFVNERLAKFYGIPEITGPEWRRVDGVRKYDRGGILGFSTTLAKQSGASRTSPILRGAWLSEVILGEKLPKPPKNVPILPDDESATDGLTVRQLVARHTSDPKCMGCHQKIDPFGFSLESFDAIGRHRTVDLGNRPIDAKTQLPDGTEIDGLTGLRKYLVEKRRDAILHQFCRKLLGYSLGRATQLSDEPLLDEMEDRLAKNNYRFSVAIDAIVESTQFREIRGRDVQVTEHQ